MSDFNSKMHQIRYPLGLCLIPHWGSYTALPISLSCSPFKEPNSVGREDKKQAGKGEGSERGRAEEVDGWIWRTGDLAQ